MSKREYRDIPYGEHERHKLDIVLPKHPAKATLIFWHGGSWLSGDKATYRIIHRSLAKLGIAVVAPNYRLFPDARWNNIVDDGAQAVAWVVKNIQSYGVQTNNVVLSGHSAGAYIAAMLVLQKSYLLVARVSTKRIKGFIGISGPYDFYPHPKLRPIFDIKDKLKKWLPISHTKNIKIPVLLIHGRLDRFVPPSNSVNLTEALRSRGSKVDLKIYSRLEHMLILAALLPGSRWMGPVRRDIKNFLYENKLI